MAKHRTYSIEFKRQVAQEYIAGDTLHALAKRHDLSRNLIRTWVFEDDARAADLLQEYEAKIAALERMVGREALEIEFLRRTWRSTPRPSSATTSVIAGPWPLHYRRMPSDGPAVLHFLQRAFAEGQ